MTPETLPIAALFAPVRIDPNPMDHGLGERSTEGALPVAPLAEASRLHIHAHLMRLSDDDRRMRFMRCMPDDAIAAHAASLDIDSDDAVRLGIRDRSGSLVAMVEGFVLGDGTTMEVAFSTDPAWRRLGLAKALEEAIAAVARDRGIERIVACCSARNVPMKAFMARCEAVTERDDDEVNAAWATRRRDRHPVDLSFDLEVGVDQAGLGNRGVPSSRGAAAGPLRLRASCR